MITWVFRDKLFQLQLQWEERQQSPAPKYPPLMQVRNLHDAVLLFVLEGNSRNQMAQERFPGK